MAPINNPYIRDTIRIDVSFSERVSTSVGDGSLYILARKVEQLADLRIGERAVVIVCDEFLGNGFLVDATGVSSTSPGRRGDNAPITPPSGAGQDGGDGGAGGAGGVVTVMCRHSTGVRINASGGSGAAGGAGGNGSKGKAATSVPGATITVTDADGVEHEEPGDPIEIPGTLGGAGGFGGDGGAGGSGGTIRYTSIVDDTAPELEAAAGPGGAGGAGGLTGPAGTFVEVPEDTPTAAADGTPGESGAEGSVSVTTLSEGEYVAGLRPLLDAEPPASYANHWAPYRKAVGQYFYRKFRQSQPVSGEQAATEFVRCLELQPDNVEALQWRHQLEDFPRPVGTVTPEIRWVAGGLNALGLRRDLDVLPRFNEFSEAFAAYGKLVLDFMRAGQDTILSDVGVTEWKGFLATEQVKAAAAQKTTLEDRDLAETESRLAAEEIASVQTQLEQTTRDIQAAKAAMEQEHVSILGEIGTIAGLAAAVVAVIAAVPSFGTSLVALGTSLVALSGAVIDNVEPIAQKLFAGEKPNTDAIKSEYDKADKQAAAVVKGAKAIVDFVKVVETLNQVTTPSNSEHMALVRHGVELTHEMLLARHRLTLAEQQLGAANARVERAAQEVAALDAFAQTLTTSREALKQTGLHAIALAEAKADALLTLAFFAQRSLEIYTLTDHEDDVQLESGHLHPDDFRSYDEGELDDDGLGSLRLADRLLDSWSGLLGVLEMVVEFQTFANQLTDRDERRLSFPAGSPEVDTLRRTRRFSFRIDPADLPHDQFDTKVRGVRLALVGATAPTSEVTCVIGHGSVHETRRKDRTIRADVLAPRSSHRDAKLGPLSADEGLVPDTLLTDPTSLAFWGRGMGGMWEFSIPDDQFEAGLDLAGLTQVQVWIEYQYLP